ncbi:FAD-dependent oxidoreductase [Staphylococcus aureus]
MTQTVNVIGAGLAGSEAAYQLAERGIKVNLIEMRPLNKHQRTILINLRNLYVPIHYAEML